MWPMGDQSVAVVPGNWVGDAATDVVTGRHTGRMGSIGPSSKVNSLVQIERPATAGYSAEEVSILYFYQI